MYGQPFTKMLFIQQLATRAKQSHCFSTDMWWALIIRPAVHDLQSHYRNISWTEKHLIPLASLISILMYIYMFLINTLRSWQKGHCFADYIFKSIPLNEIVIFWLKFQTGDKPELMMTKCKKDVTPLLTHWSYVFFALPHRCYTQVQWYSPTHQSGLGPIIVNIVKRWFFLSTLNLAHLDWRRPVTSLQYIPGVLTTVRTSELWNKEVHNIISKQTKFLKYLKCLCFLIHGKKIMYSIAKNCSKSFTQAYASIE